MSKMSSDSHNDSSVSSEDSSEDTTTELKKKIKELEAQLAVKDETIEDHKAQLAGKEKENKELIKKHAAEVSELEEEIKKLNGLVLDNDSPPPSQDSSEVATTLLHQETPGPAQSQTSNQSQDQGPSNVSRRLSYTNSEGSQDGNVIEDSGPMTVPQKLELMVGQVKNIREEVTKLKKDNEQLKHDVTHMYSSLNKKGQSAYNCIQRVRIMSGNVSNHEVDITKYVHYYNPSNGPDQDKCVKGHPLRDIAQNCTRMPPLEGEGQIYVALLQVGDQRIPKHYVGQGVDWERRWQTDSTSHERAIKEAVECLLKFDLSKLLTLRSVLLCDIEMGTTILEFMSNGQSAPAVVVYKIRSGLDQSMKSQHEQHFMNAFRSSDSIELNGKNECKDHIHECMKCRFTEYKETCRSRLEKSILQRQWL